MLMSDPVASLVSKVNGPFTLSAFTIVALGAYIASRIKGRPGAPQKPLLFLAILIFLLGLTPSILSMYYKNRTSVYRIHLSAVDEEKKLVSGVTFVSSVNGTITPTGDGNAELTVAKQLLPSDSTLTIWASKDSAFLFGNKEIRLGNDFSPESVIVLRRSEDADARGLVEDAQGAAIPGATVSIIGYGQEAATTDKHGAFVLNSHASKGQSVSIHAEADKYKAVDIEAIAGGLPRVITLTR